ncbi:MAG TPA: hypothetical protein VJB61_03980, partial [Actinomycetota bacterium]
EERADQRTAEHRRARRDAYVRFLSQALDATAVVRSVRAPGLSDAEFEVRRAAANDALDGLIPAHGLVLLEGPDELMESVQDVRDTLSTELALIRAVRQGSKSDGELWEARTARASAAGAMAEKARMALGGDIDTA